MRILLVLNLIINRLKFKYKHVSLFINNVIYFLWHIKNFKRGTYIINSRVILQKEHIDHEHFKKTTLDLNPKITLYNFCGSKNSMLSMMGFHPDLKYTIDFPHRTVTKIFKDNLNMEKYSQNRSVMSKHIVAPNYKVIDAQKYCEELIIGKPFNLNADNYYKFLRLLANYKEFLSYSAYLCDAPREIRKEFDGFYNALLDQVQINKILFQDLMFTNYMSLSKGSDIAGPNIIEAEQDLVLIDWEPKALKYRRFWVDVINLILKCDPVGFMQNKHETYLEDLFFAHEIQDVAPNRIEDKMAIILASFLTNLHSMDDIDLRDECEHLPCRGLSHITKLDMQKVIRSTKRFVHRYAKN